MKSKPPGCRPRKTYIQDFLVVAASLAGIQISKVAFAATNTAEIMVTGFNLQNSANYQTSTGAAGIVPTSINDLEFGTGYPTIAPYFPYINYNGSGTFGPTFNPGSINDLNTAETITIGNDYNGSTAATITLGGAGGSDGVAGSAATDLLYVANGATLNFQATSVYNTSGGYGTLGLALGQNGTFDIVGTSAISSALNLNSFTLTKSGAGTLSISSVISGTGGINLSSGTLYMTGTTQTYMGGTTINGGVLAVSHSDTINGTGTLTINAGTYLYNNVGGTGGTLTNAVVLGSSSSTVQIPGSDSLNYSGLISGSGTLNKTGAGELFLSYGSTSNSSNTYTGGLTVSAGSVSIDSVYELGTATSIVPDAVTLNGGTLIYSNTSAGTTASSSYRPFYVGANGGTINVSGANATFSVLGPLTNAPGSSPGSLSIVGPGTVAFSGSSTVTGVPLVIGPASGPTNSNVTFSGASPAIGSLSSTGFGTASVILGNTSSSGASTTLTIGSDGTSTTFGGAISDLSGTASAAMGKIVKTGGGTLTLSGQNTYTGATTVNAGTLNVTGSTSSSSTVTVASGATLAGAGGTVAGTINVNGTITGAASNGATGTLTTGVQNWNSGGTYLAKVAGIDSSVTANNVNDQLVLSGLNASSGFIVALQATTGSTPTFTVTNSTPTSSPLPGSYIVLAKDPTPAAGTMRQSAFQAVLSSLTLTHSGITSNNSGADPIELNTVADGGGFDVVAEDDAAPEPTSFLLLGVVSAPLLLSRRRRMAV